MDEKVNAYLALRKIEIRFYSKVFNSTYDYYLAYDGGRESKFLYWFIREYLCEESFPVEIVNSANTAEELNGLKPILGTRGKKREFQTCLDDNFYFSPLYDITDEELNEIEEIYHIGETK